MKYLLILTVLGFCGALIYLRLRPYIALVRQAFGVIRTARSLNVNDQPTDRPARAPQRDNEPLVRCTGCGTWLPASRALIFRATKAAYCSSACMERAATSTGRRSAAN